MISTLKSAVFPAFLLSIIHLLPLQTLKTMGVSLTHR